MALLAWYDANKRDMPWRKNTDWYRVWVSEIMLQQTRVATVIPYFERWMKAFPTVEALAEAGEEEVLAHWSGLGYYSRARNLHRAAKQVATSGVPERWSALPGIGPYTEAAIASISQNMPLAVVDGNVERVMSRLECIEEDVRGAGKKGIQVAANYWLDTNRPGDWNQAVMELGATVCKPAPVCHECPLQSECKAWAKGIQDRLPEKPTKRPPKEETVRFAFVRSELGVLLRKRGEGELLAGTWSLPDFDAIEAQTAYQVEPAGESTHERHVFTHRIWNMEIVPCRLVDASHAHVNGVRWWRGEPLGLSTAARKALKTQGCLEDS